MGEPSLQDRYAPDNRCFGCGPKNDQGPTPLDAVLKLRAKVTELSGDRAVVEASIEANGKVTATCRGTFVAVKEGRPAFHRW